MKRPKSEDLKHKGPEDPDSRRGLCVLTTSRKIDESNPEEFRRLQPPCLEALYEVLVPCGKKLSKKGSRLRRPGPFKVTYLFRHTYEYLFVLSFVCSFVSVSLKSSIVTPLLFVITLPHRENRAHQSVP